MKYHRLSDDLKHFRAQRRKIDFFWKWIAPILSVICLVFSVIVLLGLGGCASTPYWVKVGEPSTSVRVTIVDAMLPDPRHGYALKGRAVRNPNGTCDIDIVRVHLSQCVVDHERMHCAGYDHPDYEFLPVCRDLIPSWFLFSASGGSSAAQAWGGPSILSTPQYPWDHKEVPLTEKQIKEKLR